MVTICLRKLSFLLGDLVKVLQDGKYLKSKISHIFPNLPISEVIPKSSEESKAIGRGLTLKKFREWIEKQTNSGV